MNSNLNINESFICRIWEGGPHYFGNLKTSENELVEIIDFGKRNYDGGPDYTDAKIRISGKTLIGDIEIHRDFSGWAEHNHPKDSKYNSVILQVVLWDSKERTSPKLRRKRDVPTVILSNFLNQSIHKIWQDIINDPAEKFQLPCYDKPANITDEELLHWFGKLAIERLNMKSRRMKERLLELGRQSSGSVKSKEFIRRSNLWEQMFYEYTMEAFGFSKNKEPMLKLARNLNLAKIKSLLSKEQGDNLVMLQSLLFGAAGLLFDLRIRDEYVNELKQNWESKKSYLKISSLNKSDWHFFRLRPQNFPTLRLAYASQLILKIVNEKLFRNLILEFKADEFNVKACSQTLFNYLESVYDNYWSSHYNFGKQSKTSSRLIGRQRINDIIVNVLIPLVYLYSVIFEKPAVKKNILTFYNHFTFKPENSILKVVQNQVLKQRTIKIDTPAFEQAAIQLYNFYCVRGNCSQCKIGEHAFSPDGYEYKIIFY
jgi:hypothetical protein